MNLGYVILIAIVCCLVGFVFGELDGRKALRAAADFARAEEAKAKRELQDLKDKIRAKAQEIGQQVKAKL